MNGILVTLGAAAGKLALSILTSMLTEGLIKQIIIILVEKLAQKTDSSWDDDLVSQLRLDWNLPKAVKNEKTTPTPPSGDLG